ncbi:MAG: hypothetical protein GX023_10545 [Tissierellia bacterium]|nr:hypothetical protein [Tissierellia bacterium]
MIKERLKTFLLLSLVCISIYLTRQIWLQMPYEILPLIKKEKALDTSYLLGDMLEPYKYLLNFDTKFHTVLYNEGEENLWTSIQPILVDALSSNSFKVERLTNDEFLTYNSKRSIVFYFPEKFSTYILARSLEVNKPNNITEKIPDIDSIYIYLGIGDPFFIFSNEDKHLMVYDLGIDVKELKEYVKEIEETGDYTYYYSMKDTLGSNNDIFIPIEMSQNVPLAYVENELIPNNIEEVRIIAEKYFNKDIDYIREIVENNGSIIYVYNQKVLKINPNGLLEYFSPLEELVKERNLYISLNTVADFLSDHIGIPEDIYLTKIEEIEFEDNLGYRLTFRHKIRGLPVIISDDDIKDFIQIDVFNKYVRKYKMFIRKDMNISDINLAENKRMLSAFDIINMNPTYELLEKRYIYDKNLTQDDINRETLTKDILSSIENIDIAYVDPCSKDKEEKLIGVWLLETENRIYAFDVYTGELVFER